MPAESKAQQKAAGAALSAKRGDTKKSELKGASKGMYESMSEDELEDMASTKRKGKPEHKGYLLVMDTLTARFMDLVEADLRAAFGSGKCFDRYRNER